MKSVIKKIIFIFSIFLVITTYAANSSTDPLPSWNNTPTKQKIIEFINSVTDKNSHDYTPVAERIAAIDNDGTMWLEQPMYTQAIFVVDRVKQLALQHPEWQTEQPFKAILNNDQKALANLTGNDYEKIIIATHSNMTVDEFEKISKKWLVTAKNPRFLHHYTELAYQPMLELLNYLRANDFKVYIVTGGEQQFVRAFADKVYGVPPENIIGSTGKTQYTYQAGKPVLIRQPTVLEINDKEGKAEGINLFIGRKPLFTVGNSDGDQQMLEWTESRKGPHFMMLIHHDDAKREYAYDYQSKVGTFSKALMQEANQRGWTVVSMKNDWKVIFPFQSK